MKLKELIARLPALYYSSLEPGGPSYYIEGPPGGGKTSAIAMFPKVMTRIDPEGKWGFSKINGVNATPLTLSGFMVPDKDAKGRNVSRFSLPYWYYPLDENGRNDGRTLEDFDGGMILIDEYDKMHVDDKKMTGDASLTKTLGNHRVPDGWVFIYAGNRMGDRSGSTRDLDFLINRRIKLDVDPDNEGFLEYAVSIGMLPEIILCIEENPLLLYEQVAPDEPQRPRGTPRSWHQMSIHLRSLMESFAVNAPPTDDLAVAEMRGGLGGPCAAALVRTIQIGQQVPDFADMLKNPGGMPLPVRPDAMRLTTYKYSEKMTAANAERVMQFVTRLPGEHQTMFVRMAVSRDKKLILQKDVAAFCAKNAQLIAILNSYKNVE